MISTISDLKSSFFSFFSPFPGGVPSLSQLLNAEVLVVVLLDGGEVGDPTPRSPQIPPLPSRDPFCCRACPRDALPHSPGGLSCPHGPSIMCWDILKGPCATPGHRAPLHGRASLESAGWGAGGSGGAVLCQARRAGAGLEPRGARCRTEGPRLVRGCPKGRVSMGTGLEPLLCHTGWPGHLLWQ